MYRPLITSFCVISACLFPNAATISCQPSVHYRITKHVVLDSGAAAYLSVDPVRRRLYTGGTAVIDLDADTVIGYLPSDENGRSLAIASGLNRGISRDGIEYDLATLKPVSKLNTWGMQVTYDPLSQRAFFTRVDSVTVADAAKGLVLKTISLRHGVPGSIRSAVVDDAGHIYINTISFPKAHTT